MANPQQSGPKRRPMVLRLIATVLLSLIILVGVAVLITWIVIKPRRLVYSVEDGSIHNLNLADNHLNASFDFVIRSYNPNSKVSIYYDSLEASVEYQDQIVAVSSLDPFYQPRRNVTRLEVKLTAKSAVLTGSLSHDLKSERAAGEIEFSVVLGAKIRFKLGSWKSQDRSLKINCSPVTVYTSGSKKFERTYCVSEL